MHPEFWPYMIGFVPILFARSWPARVVAILFGLVSVGLGVYYVWSIQHGADDSTTIQHAVLGDDAMHAHTNLASHADAPTRQPDAPSP